MPTDVYFVGVEKPLRLVEGYQEVNQQLHSAEGGQFNRMLTGDERRLVTVYRASVAYIEDVKDEGVRAAIA
jgi:hypothetical protein